MIKTISARNQQPLEIDNNQSWCGRYCLGPIWNGLTAIASIVKQILASCCSCYSEAEAPAVDRQRLPRADDAPRVPRPSAPGKRPLSAFGGFGWNPIYGLLHSELNYQFDCEDLSDANKERLRQAWKPILVRLSEFGYNQEKPDIHFEIFFSNEGLPTMAMLKITALTDIGMKELEELEKEGYGAFGENDDPAIITDSKYHVPLISL